VKHEIYVENGVGRSIAQAINLFTPKHDVHALFQHEIHPGMQRPQKGDEWKHEFGVFGARIRRILALRSQERATHGARALE
jgi:hypothetical protein